MSDDPEISQPAAGVPDGAAEKVHSNQGLRASLDDMLETVRGSDRGLMRRYVGAEAPLRALIIDTAHSVNARERSLKSGGLIKSARDALCAENLQGGAGKASDTGLVFAGRLAAITSEGIIGLFEAAQKAHPEIEGQMALVAVGGYGRGYLAPFSDIDLLVLHGSHAGGKIKAGLNFILYALFDAGLAVSQAVHTPAGAAAFVKSDLNGLTSFLDARFLCGCEKLADDFARRYETIRQRTGPYFVKAKLEERDARHEASSNSRYRVEPDVKEGKGGLRDVHLLHWLMTYTSGTPDMPSYELWHATLGDETKAYLQAADFLWSVRIQLHLIRQRGDEKLTFEVQPEIARRLGYRSRGGHKSRGETRGVERFMKHYFLNLRYIGHLTGVVSARLEEANVKESRGLVGFLKRRGKERADTALITPEGAGADCANITLKGGRLAFEDHDKALAGGTDLFMIYRVQGLNPSYDLHPDSLGVIRKGAAFLNRKMRGDPETARIFAAFLTQSTDIETPLRNMSETGLLGGYIRTFGRLVGQVEYGLFRRYTLDEHIVKSIGLLNRLRRGAEQQTYPVATQILQNRADILSIYLAVLLHETGAAIKETDPRKIRQTVQRAIARFADLTEEGARISEVASTPWLMAHAASLRNPLSPALVAHFCKEVGDSATLDMYLVLSAVNARVAGIGSWDRRAGRDVVVLYGAARACFEGGTARLQANIDGLIKRRQDATARLLTGWQAEEAARFFARLPSGFWVGLEPEAAARLCMAARRVDNAGDPSASILADAPGGLYEILTYAPDRPGLFADIAGTLSEIGAQVHAAFAFPVAPQAPKAPSMASNMFIFKLSAGVTLQDVRATLDARLAERLTAQERPKIDQPRRFDDRRHDFEVATKVTTDLVSSGSCTVFEVEGLDRQGLLYALADALARLGVRLQSAYVSTYGERVVDSFYLQDKDGHKIHDEELTGEISACLVAVMEAS